MICFQMEQVKYLHTCLIRETGGLDGIRDEGLLEAALYAPFQTFGGTELYPTIFHKAARLAAGLVKNHPFLDGNKRIGAHVMLLFLECNGVALTYTQKELETVFSALASGEADSEDLLIWIMEHQ